MQGALGTLRGIVLVLLAWAMLGLALAGLLVFAWNASWPGALLFALPLVPIYGSASGYSAYYLCRAYPLTQRSVGRIVAVFALAAGSAAGAWTLAGALWHGMWQSLAPEAMQLTLSVPLKSAMFGFGVLLYAGAAVLHYLAIESARARQAERRELELALQARDAELRMLRTQIDPHFLFNSLNSISALTAFDAPGARAMTLQLAEFFRHSLGLDAQRKVTLAEELVLVRHFVAIEQVRFAERLRFADTVGADAAACLLPPMLLQPLVENAIKHGTGGMPEGGEVRVTAQRAASVLHVTVVNDIDPDSPSARSGNGVGLANVRARLATAYGHEASVHWRREGATFRVELTLPADTTET